MTTRKGPKERLPKLANFVRRNRKTIEAILLIALIYVTPQGILIGLKYALNTELPYSPVEGRSMEPNYYQGDLVFIQGLDNKSQLTIGEVIVFHRPGDWEFLIIHRIINKAYYEAEGQWYFQTKGDNNPAPDLFPTNYKGWVPASNVIGRVLLKIPYLGLIYLAMGTKIGPLTLSTILQILLIVAILIIYLKEDENEKSKNTHRQSFIK